MIPASRKESYSVCVDAAVRSGPDLFEVWTDAIYLGCRGITNWDAFEELMRECFEHRDIFVRVTHADLSGLPEQDRRIYDEILFDIASDHPDKLVIQTGP